MFAQKQSKWCSDVHAKVEDLAAIAFYENAGSTVTDRLIHTVEHDISYDEWVLVKCSAPTLEVPAVRKRTHS